MNWGRAPRRIQAHDRRKAAVHEAGHFIVGQYVGLKSGSAWIGPREALNKHESTWAGQHSCLSHEHDGLSRCRKIMIAVSGFIAERSWDQMTQPNEWPVNFQDALQEPETMSDTDWISALHEPGTPTSELVRACQNVDALLCPGCLLWPALIIGSRQLIVHGWLNYESMNGGGKLLEGLT